MDESLLQAVSQHMNVPSVLISRSASARAEANGTDVDDVLKAWLGGEQVVEAAPQVAVVEEEVAVVEEEVAVVEEEVAVQVIEEEAPPPVGLVIRLYKSIGLGFIFGILSGIVQVFIVGNTFFEGVYLDPDSTSIIAEYSTTRFIFTVALTTAIFSIFNMTISKKNLDSSYEWFGIETSDRESAFLGLGLGLVFGAIYSAVIVNSIGTVVEGVLEDEPTLFYIPVFAALIRIALYSLISQIFITALGQVFGVPKGLSLEERSEVVKIRDRINGSIILPLGAIFGGGLVAVAISQVFINFHSYAPLLAIIISAAVLLFASLISSAPNIKVTKSEIWVSLLGILTLIVVISSIAYVQH